MRALYALQPLMTNCGCELVEMDLSESSVELQIRNASSLIKRPLKVDGYKIVIDNPESSESDVAKKRAQVASFGNWLDINIHCLSFCKATICA